MGTGMKIVFSVIGVIAVVLLLSAGGWAWRYYTAEVRGVVDAEEQIQSGDNRIQNYNWFFEMCHTVISYRDRIQNQEKRLEYDIEAKEAERVRANIAGLRSQQARAVQKYNARARQEYTAGQFKSADLPYEINENTDCK